MSFLAYPDRVEHLRVLRDELCVSVWGWTSVEHEGEEFISEPHMLAATDRIYALSDALDAAVNLLTETFAVCEATEA